MGIPPRAGRLPAGRKPGVNNFGFAVLVGGRTFEAFTGGVPGGVGSEVTTECCVLNGELLDTKEKNPSGPGHLKG